MKSGKNCHSPSQLMQQYLFEHTYNIREWLDLMKTKIEHRLLIYLFTYIPILIYLVLIFSFTFIKETSLGKDSTKYKIMTFNEIWLKLCLFKVEYSRNIFLCIIKSIYAEK